MQPFSSVLYLSDSPDLGSPKDIVRSFKGFPDSSDNLILKPLFLPFQTSSLTNLLYALIVPHLESPATKYTSPKVFEQKPQPSSSIKLQSEIIYQLSSIFSNLEQVSVLNKLEYEFASGPPIKTTFLSRISESVIF